MLRKFAGKIGFQCYAQRHSKCDRSWCKCVHHELDARELQRVVMNRVDGVQETEQIKTIRFSTDYLNMAREIIRNVTSKQ